MIQENGLYGVVYRVALLFKINKSWWCVFAFCIGVCTVYNFYNTYTLQHTARRNIFLRACVVQNILNDINFKI